MPTRRKLWGLPRGLARPGDLPAPALTRSQARTAATSSAQHPVNEKTDAYQLDRDRERDQGLEEREKKLHGRACSRPRARRRSPISPRRCEHPRGDGLEEV